MKGEGKRLCRVWGEGRKENTREHERGRLGRFEKAGRLLVGKSKKAKESVLAGRGRLAGRRAL